MNQMLSRNLISKVPLQVLQCTDKYELNEYTNKSPVVRNNVDDKNITGKNIFRMS